MTFSLADICRHPIKSVGYESIERIVLSPAEGLPLDRKWAVAHALSAFDGGWAPKANFLRGVIAPALMAVRVTTEDNGRRLHLSHPDRPDTTVAPGDPDDEARLMEWLAPLWPDHLPSPAQLVSAGDGMLSDVPEPWVAIATHASRRTLSGRAGRDLSIHRWRANLWVESTAPWEEFDWVGRLVRIGEAEIFIRERITRCKATSANPDTGQRDTDTLGLLSDFGHQEFGVYGVVVRGGVVATGDSVEVPE